MEETAGYHYHGPLTLPKYFHGPPSAANNYTFRSITLSFCRLNISSSSFIYVSVYFWEEKLPQICTSFANARMKKRKKRISKKKVMIILPRWQRNAKKTYSSDCIHSKNFTKREWIVLFSFFMIHKWRKGEGKKINKRKWCDRKVG